MKTLRPVLRYPFVWIGVAAIYALPLLTLKGAFNMYIKFADLTGESTDKGHEGESDVLAWSWGASNSGSFAGGGKTSVQDLSLTKYVDRTSPDLLLRTFNGKQITDATLTVERVGASTIDYIKIVMTQVLVSSLSTGGSESEGKLTENVSLNFGKVAFTYTPEGDKGTTIVWDMTQAP